MAITPKESEALDFDPTSRTRRGVFVFGGTIMFAVLAAVATWLRDGEVAKTFVEGCLGIIELMVISYLFTTSLDRSEVLKNIGLGLRRYGTPQQQQQSQYGYQQYPQYQQPPQPNPYQQPYPGIAPDMPPPSPDDLKG